MKKLLIIMIAFALLLAGCGGTGEKGTSSDSNGSQNKQAEKTQDVKSPKSSLTIAVPEDWSEIDNDDTSKNPSSTIRMQSKDGLTAILVVEEKASDFEKNLTLEKYSEMITQVMQNARGSGNWKVGTPEDATVGDDIPAKQRVMSATMNGVKVEYLQTVFKTQKHFVEILELSTPSNFEGNKDIFDGILKSVKF